MQSSTSSPPEHVPPFTIDPEPVETPEARAAIQQYFDELNSRFPDGFDTAYGSAAADGDFAPPSGIFLLVRVDGQVAGCGALRTDSDGSAEVKRMWVAPSLRGRGAGRSLLAELESHARRFGCHRVRLDTAAELHEAQALYLSAGYREIPAYNANQYAKHWFEKVFE